MVYTTYNVENVIFLVLWVKSISKILFFQKKPLLANYFTHSI